jgi:hypothetical protein
VINIIDLVESIIISFNMTNSTDIHTQLTELAVEITIKVAEMLAYAAKNMVPSEREKIHAMLEENLPTVVTNTIFKTTQLHSQQGVDHLRKNLENYAHQIAQSIIRHNL